MRCSLRRRKLGWLLLEAPDQPLVSTLWIKVDCSLKCDAGLRHRGAWGGNTKSTIHLDLSFFLSLVWFKIKFCLKTFKWARSKAEEAPGSGGILIFFQGQNPSCRDSLTLVRFHPFIVNTPHFLTIKGVEVNAGQTASFHCTVNGRKRDSFRLWLQVRSISIV